MNFRRYNISKTNLNEMRFSLASDPNQLFIVFIKTRFELYTFMRAPALKANGLTYHEDMVPISVYHPTHSSGNYNSL